MSRPKNADGQRTRQAILDAALDLFAEKGFFGTSLRDIATVVGVRESALYNYFPSKDALFDELIVSSQEEKTERLQAIAADASADGRAVLELLAVTILESYVQPRQQQLFRVLLSDGIRLARKGHFNLLERLGSGGRGPIHDLIRRLTADGLLRDGDVTMTVVAFIGPLLLWRHVRAINASLPLFDDLEAFARLHVDQFLRGAAKQITAPARSHTRHHTRRRAAQARVRRPRLS